MNKIVYKLVKMKWYWHLLSALLVAAVIFLVKDHDVRDALIKIIVEFFKHL